MKNKKKLVIIIIIVAIILIGTAIFFWINNSKKVSFKFNNGITISQKEVKVGTTINELEIPIKEGYKFSYWTINGKKCTGNEKIKTGDVIKAVWTESNNINEDDDTTNKQKETFTIKFDTDGGNTIENIEIEAEQILEKPKDPTKAGYKFKYWTLEEKEYNFTEPVTKNMTLKALWIKEEPIAKQYYCDNGYTLSGTKCTKVETINATVIQTCDELETLTSGKCIAQEGVMATGKCPNNETWSIQDYLCYTDPSCETESGNEPVMGCYEDGNWQLINGTCYNYTTPTTKYSCNSGYTLSGTKCSKTTTIDAKSK